jgi:hypothetical protein
MSHGADHDKPPAKKVNNIIARSLLQILLVHCIFPCNIPGSGIKGCLKTLFTTRKQKNNGVLCTLMATKKGKTALIELDWFLIRKYSAEHINRNDTNPTFFSEI